MKINATLVNTTIENVTENSNEVNVRCISKINLTKIPGMDEEALDSILKAFPKVNYNDFLSELIYYTEANAKCSPEDTYDKVLGQRIAESRAQSKAYNIARRIYNIIMDNIADKFYRVRQLLENSYNCEVHCFLHQAELGGIELEGIEE